MSAPPLGTSRVWNAEWRSGGLGFHANLHEDKRPLAEPPLIPFGQCWKRQNGSRKTSKQPVIALFRGRKEPATSG